MRPQGILLAVATSAAWLLGAVSASPVATVRDGRILRDEATRKAIVATAPASLGVADRRLVVSKSRLCLEVWEGDRRVKVFPVALGPDPVARKERQGDGRTPEGTYTLVPHHPSPGFGACFYVCYPGPEDVRRGLAAGLVDPGTARRITRALTSGTRPPHDTALGGLILLHGTKDRRATGLTDTNWTLGCIAMENTDVTELLGLYRAGDRPQLFIEH